MIVNEQKQIELVNLCNALYEQDEVVAAILYMADLYGRPVQRLKRVFMYGNYPAVSIYGDKIHLHRLLGIYWWRDDDGEFDAKYVHHKNHNKLDARRHNLELLDVFTHQSYHTKGRIFTEEHKRKISEVAKMNNSDWPTMPPWEDVLPEDILHPEVYDD